MSTRVKTSSKSKKNRVGPVRRLNVSHPLLKIVLPILAICLSLEVFYAFLGMPVLEPSRAAVRSPMLKHPEATKRSVVNKKLVALTFDDGPSSATTPNLLNILKEKDVVVTFFVIGEKAESNADTIRRALSEGHEIASHTMYHQNLAKLNGDQIRSNIADSVQLISAVSNTNVNLTRPPYGSINENVLNNTTTPLINWSVDTLDWKSQNKDAIMETTLAQIHDGAIILMHDIYQTTVDTVPVLIDRLRQEGYEFVTIPELARERRVKLLTGQVYYNFTP